MDMETELIESDEREEGEIVEDDLEDVSDVTISSSSPLHFGKSVSPPELLRAVSLSSLSDDHSSRIIKGHKLYGCSLQENQSSKHKICKRKRHKNDLYTCSCRYHRHRHQCRKRHHKRYFKSSSDSESEKPDYKTLHQLKEAVHINSTKKSSANLRNRLQPMIKGDCPKMPEDDPELLQLRDLALLSSKANSEENDSADFSHDHSVPLKNNFEADDEPSYADNTDDKELIQLRLEALKSAVLKKHQNRKKRKDVQVDTVESDQIDKPSNCGFQSNLDLSEIDKENSQSVINQNDDNMLGVNSECKLGISSNAILNLNSDSNSKVTKNGAHKLVGNVQDANDLDNNMSLEEDLDVMRAVLLASVSNKITSIKSSSKNMVENSKSVPVVKKKISQFRTVAKKINSSSSTINTDTIKPSLHTLPNTIRQPNNRKYVRTNNKLTKINKPPEFSNKRTTVVNNVSNPLVEPFIINVNADSDSDTENCFSYLDNKQNQLKETVTQFLKQQRAEVDAKTSNSTNDNSPDKSIVKLLPKSQQLEYHKLKQILNSRKKARIKRLNPKVNIISDKKGDRFKQDCVGKTGISIIKSKDWENKSEQLSSLQKTLADLQVNKDGRLQMKGKYEELVPFLKQVNEASYDRQQHEIKIKKLLEELQKSRALLATSHETFTSLVQELIMKKNEIDKRCSVPNCSSSVVKRNPQVEVVAVSTKDEEMMKLIGTPSTDNPEIFVEAHQEVAEETTVKDIADYTSPLDNKLRSDVPINPLIMLCPYDLLGVCKDQECPHKHCS